MDEPLGLIDVVTPDRGTIPLNIESQLIIPREHLAKNIAANLGKEIPRFVFNSGRGSRKNEPLAIVSSGHSLNEQWDELRTFKNILTCGSAHDHVVRHGIIPTYAAVSDAGVDDKGNLSLKNLETTYIIASQCDPGLYDHLAGHHVEMWHYKGQAYKSLEEEAVALKGEPSIAWGSSITMNSFHIAFLLGFQDLHFFGFDNCYSKYGVAQHACQIAGGIEYQKQPFHVGKRFFISNLALAAQVEQFFKLVEAWHQWIHVTLHGDGLAAEMVKQGDPLLQEFISLA